ncbi:MAG: AMP-binding protein [Firmicutes bacterium]|nr:AMP-binding protein [Bacillota bacterium]
MGNVNRYVKDYKQYENFEGWEKLSFGEQLRNWSRLYGDKIAVIEEDKQITYIELDEKIDELAFGLRDIGIKVNDNIVLQLPNRISMVIAFFAISRAGAVPIMVLPAHREAELEGIFNLAKPTAYIIPERYLGYDYTQMADKLKDKHSSVKHVIVDGEEGETLLKDIKGKKKVLPELNSYKTGVLLLSGGTTGSPKLIPRTHTDYIYNAKTAAKHCRLDQNSVYLTVLPAAHNFSLSCPGILGTLSSGGRVVMSKTPSPDIALPLIQKEKVTIIALVPAMLGVFMEMLEEDKSYDLSSLEILQVGGAMLEDKLAEEVIETWPCKLQQVFGTAEGLICFTALDDSKEIITSCQGKPISEADEIKIVDKQGLPVADGVYGELLARGPYTIDSYYKAAEANKKSFTEEGYYCTGDRAMITKEGNIRIGGRIKEQINRAGEKIMPAEIETYLLEYPDVKEAIVIGILDQNLGERTCAFLLTRDDVKIELSALHQFLENIGVARYKMPDQVEFVDMWPVTSVGKIDKKELAQRVQTRTICK